MSSSGTGNADDEGDPECLLEEHVLAHQAMLPEEHAVVRGEEDVGVAELVGLPERGDQPGDGGVDVLQRLDAAGEQ